MSDASASHTDVSPEPLLYALAMGAGVAASVLACDLTFFVAVGMIAFAVRIARARDLWTPDGRFGLANTLTAGRLAIVVALEPAFAALPSWAFVGVIIGIFALDGLDGYVARRQGLASDFGSTFDMEADAFFVMLLCLLLWSHDIVGAWVLVAGLWRYVYAAAVVLMPKRGAAPRTLLGRSVYAILVISLAGSFLPAPPYAAPLAGLGTVLVTISFLRSFTWSLRNGQDASSGAGDL